ncbi:hypothetical protein GIB67_038380 [Kingdonia uniflora]|uniref:Uncharacterized protein n=1 Tax=Kingdonia uniflora TaxID=39325 RepID=A0A7J7NP39_9MAGN|nr:hypothetical protein GIB67_038380 [Kingdonia uniflora]
MTVLKDQASRTQSTPKLVLRLIKTIVGKRTSSESKTMSYWSYVAPRLPWNQVQQPKLTKVLYYKVRIIVSKLYYLREMAAKPQAIRISPLIAKPSY